MTRSRRRKLMRTQAIPLGAAILAGLPTARAQDQQPVESGGLDEVIVSAQKRTENLQDVPLSITALGNETLEKLHVQDFDDYAKFLPSVSYQSFGPGFARVIMRGVSSGDNGNHSGPLPTVGMYLDEQPITTIQGPLDIHMYDIARVEALAGPQGTLYGASSQAGTIRIITNKPDTSGFKAGYDLEGSVLDGSGGYTAEGFANIPLGSSERAAIRLVGWTQHAPGYIDNIHGTKTYPSGLVTIDNARFAKNNYNDTDTSGARVALRVNLNDTWTVTPTFMGQTQTANGVFAFDPRLGDLKVLKVRPDKSVDRWGQAALTIEGKLGNFDVTYAGAFLKRNDDTQSDYSDYTYFYDVLYSYVWPGDGGSIIDPTQYIKGKDRYKKYSHELRFASPSDRRVRFVGGLFTQRQTHGIEQRYKIDDFNNDYEVSGWADTIWLTEQRRVDKDEAVFGELSFDIAPNLTVTGGGREFRAKNTLKGFFGYGDGWSDSGTNGEALCSILAGDPAHDESSWVPFKSVSTAPCTNLDKHVTETGFTPKVNLTWRVTDNHMLYTTFAKGFRPGGVNRRGTFPPYDSDYLKSYEIGWKTSWVGNRLRFNGAFFWEDWNDFQFSFLGDNGLTNITNAGTARIKGVETEFNWAATDHFDITGGLALLDPKLTEDFCENLDANGKELPFNQCDPVSRAASGTQLPVTPKFKSNLTGRYLFTLGAFDAHVQAAMVYQGASRSSLLPGDEAVTGRQPSYGLADISAGINNDRYSVELFVNNAFDKRADLFRFVQCDEQICSRVYTGVAQPRTIGLKFAQKF